MKRDYDGGAWLLQANTRKKSWHQGKERPGKNKPCGLYGRILRVEWVKERNKGQPERSFGCPIGRKWPSLVQPTAFA
jgi:hypothetical protein